MDTARGKTVRLRPPRVVPAFVVAPLVLLTRLLRWTYRVRIIDPGGVRTSAGPWPAIFVLWHNRILFLAQMFPRDMVRRAVVLTSGSRDGGYAAAFARGLGLEVVRGSSSRGGHAALRELRRALTQHRSVVITVDGPRGPRYTVHPGAVLLAEMTGLPIVPLAVNARSRWDLRGWDRTQVPRPFSRVELVIGSPLEVAAGLTPEQRQTAGEILRERLLSLTSDETEIPFAADIVWRAPDAPPEVRSGLCTGAWQAGAIEVKRNRQRTVWHVPAGPEHDGLFVKHDHPTTVKERLKAWFRCKCEREYLAGRQLTSHGVSVVPMLAWARNGGDSFLVTGEVPGTEEFRTVWRRVAAAADGRRAFLAGLGVFLECLRQARVQHRDLHTGNVLVSQGASGFRFTLVDPYGVRVGGRHVPSPLQLLGWLAVLARELTLAEGTSLLDAAGCGGQDQDRRLAWRAIMDARLAQARRTWRSRRPKILGRGGDLCEKHRTAVGVWRVRHPFDLVQAVQAVLSHLQHPPAPTTERLKKDTKRRLTRVRVGEETYVVKEFRWDGWRGPWAPDRQSWLNNYHLELYRVPVAITLAWLRHSDGRGFIVMEDVGRAHLAGLLAETAPGRARRDLLAATGRLVAWLHRAGIDHGDLKAGNFMHRPHADWPTMPLVLVDSDEVRFGVRLTTARRARSLSQVFESVHRPLSAWDRGRLLVAYAREAALSRPQLRRISARLRGSR